MKTTRTMRLSAALFLSAGLLLGATAANAKDVCLQTSGGIAIVLKSVKSLKPGKAIALTGIGIDTQAARPFPVDGAAIMDSAGQISVGLTLHGMDAVNGNFGYTWTADATYAGTGNVDINGNNTTDGSRTFTRVDCATIAIP